MQLRFWNDNGPTCGDTATCEHSLGPANGTVIASSAAIRARRTAGPDSATAQANRRLAVSSSALLMNFARNLFSARIQAKRELTHRGLGTDSETSLSDLVTLCCPSNSEPVVLGLTDKGSGCSCSLKGPTPCARDWKDNGDVEKVKRQYERNLREKRGLQFPRWVAFHHGFVPGPIVYEVALGFPEDWTSIESGVSEIPFVQQSPSGLENES